MTVPSTEQYVHEAQDRAASAERSPYTVLLKIARVLVWVVYVIVVVTAILLTLAFFLRLAGANPEAGFVEWVNRSVDRAMRPFRGIFPERPITDDSVFDPSLLFAAVVYLVLALLIDGVLRWLTRRLHRQEREALDLRNEADRVARWAAAEQQSATSAAQQAAAREYAAQQAAADRYAIAQAAAQEALARHTAQQDVAQQVRAKPAPPAPPSPPAATMPQDVGPGSG